MSVTTRVGNDSLVVWMHLSRRRSPLPMSAAERGLLRGSPRAKDENGERGLLRGSPRAKDENGERYAAAFVGRSSDSPTHWLDDDDVLHPYIDAE